MRVFLPLAATAAVLFSFRPIHAADGLPFGQKVEVFREKQSDVVVFTVRLEQPFLAEEFEKSNYLRLRSSDERAYLIYPKETTFQQKHAEFYGRLRGQGTVNLQLAYEIVSENPDGSRHVQTRQGEIEVAIPAEPTGLPSLYQQWAQQQNLHLAGLLRYYPEDSFSQYVLLQSRARYGVALPSLALDRADSGNLETDLYQVFTGSMAIQEAMQRTTLATTGRTGDLNIPVSNLAPPALTSLPYKDLLEQKRIRDKIEPKVAEIARLVPADQYFLQLNSMQSLDELLELSVNWGGSLLRLFTVAAQDQQLEGKLQEQLCLHRDLLTRLFADGVISELAFTGADPFVYEGTDVTVIFRVKQPALFQQAASGWLAAARKAHADLTEANFNYRGHKVLARYTPDRGVSSFVVQHNDYMIYSNSHRAVRRAVDAAVGASPALYDSLDYRYVTTLLPPSAAANSGYFFVPEAMIRRLVAPAAKISEKRRLQCYNSLVMLNNASLFFRMEFGRSPKSLAELVQGRFVDLDKIVCPHGGAYAFDAGRDACTCSLHNRLKYLTPIIELNVLGVSQNEAAEYDRYKQRYQAFWQGMFDPIAIRLTMDRRAKIETCVLPMANGSIYNQLRSMIDKTPRPLDSARIAPSALASLVMVPGRKAIGEQVRQIPGVAEVLQANPTLTDLGWLGDRVGLHVCDGDSILQVDPTLLRSLNLPLLGNVSIAQQGAAAALLTAVRMPVYVTIDVENREQAAKLLEQLSQHVILQGTNLGGLRLSADAYRLPDYKGHPLYVFAVELYAVRLRLHVAVVGDQIVVATKPDLLREVIDAVMAKDSQTPAAAHLLVRFNRRGLNRAYDDAQLYWEEKARAACNRNISSIQNLVKLYGVTTADLPRLSEAKYGVRYFCPDDGDYRFDAERNRVDCSVHGNREQSRQNRRPDHRASFARFIENIDELTLTLRFQDDALLTTIEIQRDAKAEGRNPTGAK
jgi:hypothetical protein